MQMQDIMPILMHLQIRLHAHQEHIIQAQGHQVMMIVMMQMQDITSLQPVKHHKQNVQQGLTKQIQASYHVMKQMQDITFLQLLKQHKLNVQ